MRYVFADCVLDTESHGFARGGQSVALEPQVFDLLQVLAENAGKLVTKDALIAAVWGGRIVSEATISSRINMARSAVGDSGKAQAIIQTVPRRGFRLVAPVRVGKNAYVATGATVTHEEIARSAVGGASGVEGRRIA